MIPSRRGESRKGFLQLIWEQYLRSLKSRPIRTKALTAAAIFAISDVCAQALNLLHVANSVALISWRRTAVVALWGACWAGPTAHGWQAFMENLTRGRKDMPTILLKVLIDQVTFGPLNILVTMAFLTLTVEDTGWAHLFHKIYHDYPLVQLNGWKLWPAAAMFNYRYVPLHLRVLFLNLVALGWTTFMNVQATRQKAA